MLSASASAAIGQLSFILHERIAIEIQNAAFQGVL
jgi:hypothetical protein